MSETLQAPVRISEIAKDLGWEYERTRRWLTAVNKEANGTLLIEKPGLLKPSYLVFRSSLKKAFPEMFESAKSVAEQLEDHVEELSTLRRGLEAVARVVGEMRGAEKKDRTGSPQIPLQHAVKRHG